VSVLLSWPGWLETQLTSWKDRHEMNSSDFTGDTVTDSIDTLVYWKAYNVSSVTDIDPYSTNLGLFSV